MIIPASKNFLSSVADVFYEAASRLHNPLLVSQMRVYLPNNRSCRAFKDILVNCGNHAVFFVPKILSPVSSLPSKNRIDAIINMMEMIKNKYSINAKLDLATALFNDIRNIIQEQIDLGEFDLSSCNQALLHILSTAINSPQIFHTIEDSLKELVQHTEYVRNNDIPCIIAGFSYSHKYLLEFIKSAHTNPNNILINQESVDNCEFTRKFWEYIGYMPVQPDTPRNFGNVALIEPLSSLDEIKVVSSIVRQNIESGKTIVIVYTDKQLISGIRLFLKRWNIHLDDSSGLSFKDTKIATIALLFLKAMKSNFSTCDVIELIKFIPEIGDNILDFESFVAYQEKAMLFFDGAYEKYIQNHGSVDNNIVISYIRNLCGYFNNKRLSAIELSETFDDFMDFITRFTKCDYIEIMDEILENLCLFSEKFKNVSYEEYYHAVIKIMSMYSARSPFGYTKNVIAVGPLEAQSISGDISIICGFNENKWVVKPSSYLFDNAQRIAMNLNIDDRRNSNIKNVINHLLQSSNEVFITRSQYASGGQQEPCHLIYEFFNADSLDQIRANGNEWIITPKYEEKKSVRPAPSPALQFRPKSFSVSDIENLINNPYSLYAKKILKLTPISDITSDREMNRLKGTILHKALKKAILADNPMMEQNLEQYVKSIVENIGLDQYHFSDWILKVQNIAKFVADHIKHTPFLEIAGSMDLQITPELSVTVKCIADNITIHEGEIIIIDYKTGTLPSVSEIIGLDKPQLIIEGLIAIKNGFYGLHNYPVKDLQLVQLGGSESTMRVESVVLNRDIKSSEVLHNCITSAEDFLINLLKKYTIDLAPFYAYSGMYYDEYGHLSRGKEWGMYK